MNTGRFERFLPVAGILAGVLLLAGVVLTSGSEPADDASQATIVAYYSDHYTAILVATLLCAPLFAFFSLFFTAGLRSAIRSGEAGESSYSTVVALGGVATAIGIVVSGMIGAAAAEAADSGSSGTVVETLDSLSNFSWVPWAFGAGAFLIATGLGGLRTTTLPRPLSWISLVLGVVAVTPLGFVTWLLMPLWFIGTGIVLARRGQRTTGATAVPAAA